MMNKRLWISEGVRGQGRSWMRRGWKGNDENTVFMYEIIENTNILKMLAFFPNILAWEVLLWVAGMLWALTASHYSVDHNRMASDREIQTSGVRYAFALLSLCKPQQLMSAHFPSLKMSHASLQFPFQCRLLWFSTSSEEY